MSWAPPPLPTNSGRHTVIPGSRRPDGTYRKNVVVRAGYVNQDEMPAYEAPAARRDTMHSACPGAVFTGATHAAPLRARPCGIPGAEVIETPQLPKVLSKAQRKNEKRKQKKAEKRHQEDEERAQKIIVEFESQQAQGTHPAPGPAPPATKVTKTTTTTSTSSAPRAEAPAASAQPQGGNAARNLTKKIRKAQQLKERFAGGGDPNEDQRRLIDSLPDLEQQLEALTLRQ